MNYQPLIAQNKLIELRLAKGLTQAKVAWHLGLDMINRISYWEHDHAFPSLPNLFKLCALYEATPQEIYGDLVERVRGEVHLALKNRPLFSQADPNELGKPIN